ncbi:hypothetical protein AAFN46_07460 [Pseudomonas sp. CAU 1711]|uniref:hypothetical protein n=1 Tax=Pseudomonas sp. CAU 1711 TaxID=3140356 RepID=UPI003260FF5E
MRLPLALVLLLSLVGPARAADATLERVLELAGVTLLCEQTAPLLQRGMSAEQQKALGRAFAAAPLCADLTRRVAPALKPAQLQEALQLLESPLARHLTAAERAVGEDGGLAVYRQQLQERPPLGRRVELVRRLDKAAHTTELATLLRYEVGKTQALLALRARGGDLDEQALGEQTAAQLAPLRASSAQGVEAFMLYAYRQTPSDQLEEYAALYEQAPLRAVLEASAKALPAVFAARRAQLK